MTVSNKFERSNIELHYWFTDESHTMDAVVQNRCEYEFLGIIKEVATTFKVEIIVETEPLGEGGLRRWFKIVSKEENKKATITTAIISILLTTIITTPLSTALSKATELIFEKVFENPEAKKLETENQKLDNENKQLENEKLRLEIQKLEQEVKPKVNILEDSHVIKKKKSNFFEILETYPKVEKISFNIENDNQEKIFEEKIVLRKDFKEFILASDELEPIEQDNVVIEIISPVLKKRNYRWMGIYNGETIPFSMKSKEFKELVQAGQVQFKNGTSINCQVTIKRKITSEGIVRIYVVEVNRVNSYFEGEISHETPEGKTHRKEKEADESQFKLFS